MKKNINIHIDDAGLSKSTNNAIFDLHNEGLAFSTSLMVNTMGFNDYVERYKKLVGEKIDTGVHLTLTSEWDGFKTKPISDINNIESLVDDNGNFYDNLDDVFNNFDSEHVKKEINNQISFVLDHGIDISHIDSHMGVLLHKKFFKYYLEFAEKYNIIPFVKYPDNPYNYKHIIGSWFGGCGLEIDEYLKKGFNIFDGMDPYSLSKEDYYSKGLNGFTNSFVDRLKNLPGGNNYFLFHVLDSKGEGFILDKEKRYIEFMFIKYKLMDILEKNGIGTYKIKNFNK